jgi:aromatic ring-opening dioxygenase LigB subunit
MCSALGLVFGAIAPHGGLAIEEACTPEEAGLATRTRAGMRELGRAFANAEPQVVVVATPHNIHLPGAFGVVVAGRVAGDLGGTPQPVALDVPGHPPFAWAILEAMIDAGLAAMGVSFGSNDPESAVAPMDWGVLIPLWFMGGRHDPPLPTVVVAPSRDLSAADHVSAGAAVAAAAGAAGLRVAFIASADHGHAHLDQGPYGYHPAARDYDDLVCDIVRRDRLEELGEIPAELIASAKADSWWQMLMLHGATGDGWRGRLISYEAPTYFGMLTAVYLPAPREGPSAPEGRRRGGGAPKPTRGSSSPPRKRIRRRTQAR